MIDYKDSSISFLNKYEKVAFFDNVNQNLVDTFEIVNSNHELEIFSDSDFWQLLYDVSEAFNNGNWLDLRKLLLILLDQFSLPNEIVQNRCKIFQKLKICSDLMERMDDSYIMDAQIAPLILQLFTNILAVEDDNHEFALFSIQKENRGIEIIMHLKRTLPKPCIPLLLIYIFNIYQVCSHYIINETTELYDYVYSYMNDQYRHLYPLAMINLLRNEEIEYNKLPQDFFKNLIIIASNPDSRISIFSMWCLYFYFKKSYKHASNAIQKELLILLNSKILNMDNLIETKIALYIFSYCYLVDSNTKILKCIQKTPILDIIQLMNFEDKEISALSIAFCNNYIIVRPSNLTYFIENGGFEIVCEIAKNGPLNCKIEAGIALLSILEESNDEDLESLYNPDTLSILCDLLHINNEELDILILQFIIKSFPFNEWVIEFLLSEDFEDELWYIQESSDNQLLLFSIEKILKFMNYKRNEFEDQ